MTIPPPPPAAATRTPEAPNDLPLESLEDELNDLQDQVEERLSRRDLPGIRSLLADEEAPDVADVLERLSPDEREEVFAQLSGDLAAEALAETDGETQRDLLEDLEEARFREVLSHLPVDDLAQIITDVPEQREHLLSAIEPDDRGEVQTLLTFPEQSAGRLMTDQYVRVGPDQTVAQVLEHIRGVDGDCETLTDLYVCENIDRLIGVFSLRELVLARPDQRVADLMETDVISVAPTEDQEVAARLVARYNFLALPVVQNGRILGIVTVDDIIDVLTQENTEDQLKQSAVEPGVLNAPYFATPLWRVVRSRIGWLVLLFVAETATGSVLRGFDEELQRVTALSFFIPLLIGTGGNTGAQTVSTIIRGLALKEVRLRDTGRVLVRELAGGALLGLLLGTIAFGRALMWHSGFQLSLVVGLTILAICTWANTIGSLIPLAAAKFKVDPALVSAPLITTLVDATGLAIYLLIAKALLSQLH